MKSYVIHFIRHGAIDETLSGKYIGTTDAELSDKGKAAEIENALNTDPFKFLRLYGMGVKTREELFEKLDKSPCNREFKRVQLR